VIKVAEKFTGTFCLHLPLFCTSPHGTGLCARVPVSEADSHPNPLINLVLALLWGPRVVPP